MAESSDQELVQDKSHESRSLTDEEKLKLDETVQISEFQKTNLEKNAKKNWDLFYKRNEDRFFKDRHWITREFSDFKDTLSKISTQEGHVKVFEVGCGVGNLIFPLLEEEKGLFVYACDFSPVAIDLVKKNPNYDVNRCSVFVADLTQEDLTSHVPSQSVDIVTLVFVLSAIHPDKMVAAIKNIRQVLKPSGCIWLRDYGLYDHAMLRFQPSHKIDENFYFRQDGTRAYYFSLETIKQIMGDGGMAEEELYYVHRRTENKKEQVSVPRVFIQGKFIPTTPS